MSDTSSSKSLWILWFLMFLGISCEAPLPEVDLIIQDVYVYPAPELSAIEHANLVMDGGLITQVLGPESKLPPAKQVIEGKGLYATAGFWNLHVHFTQPKWFDASEAAKDSLQQALDEMLNQYGFTSVLDIGSDLANTQKIRDRIESGELKGPKIMSAGSGFVIEGGSPAYLEVKLPEFLSAENARKQVAENIAAGADHIKLFTGSFLGVGNVAVIPPTIAKAAVEEAHKHKRKVASHPQSLAGLESAVFAGVDMLAHTAPDAGKLSDSLLNEMKQKEMLLVPTLQLWRWELGRVDLPPFVIDKTEAAAVEQVRDYRAVGGKIAFGTDVGYMWDYNTAEEFTLLEKAGMNFDQILAALTTNPEEKFGNLSEKGKVAVGQVADLVLLSKNPKSQVENFSTIKYTIRAGKVVFKK